MKRCWPAAGMPRFETWSFMKTIARTLLATVSVCSSVHAAGASAVITGISGLYIEVSIQTRRDLCSARFKDTQAAWHEGMASWQSRNSAVLAELKALAAQHEAGQAADATAATVLQQFKLMAALAPATNLAPLADEQAAWVCGQWLSDLEPAAKVDATLPALLDAARKLRSTAR